MPECHGVGVPTTRSGHHQQEEMLDTRLICAGEQGGGGGGEQVLQTLRLARGASAQASAYQSCLSRGCRLKSALVWGKCETWEGEKEQKQSLKQEKNKRNEKNKRVGNGRGGGGDLHWKVSSEFLISCTHPPPPPRRTQLLPGQLVSHCWSEHSVSRTTSRPGRHCSIPCLGGGGGQERSSLVNFQTVTTVPT